MHERGLAGVPSTTAQGVPRIAGCVSRETVSGRETLGLPRTACTPYLSYGSMLAISERDSTHNVEQLGCLVRKQTHTHTHLRGVLGVSFLHEHLLYPSHVPLASLLGVRAAEAHDSLQAVRLDVLGDLQTATRGGGRGGGS